MKTKFLSFCLFHPPDVPLLKLGDVLMCKCHAMWVKETGSWVEYNLHTVPMTYGQLQDDKTLAAKSKHSSQTGISPHIIIAKEPSDLFLRIFFSGQAARFGTSQPVSGQLCCRAILTWIRNFPLIPIAHCWSSTVGNYINHTKCICSK